MGQSRQSWLEQLSSWNSHFGESTFYPIQKAYSSAHYVQLVVRFPGVTRHMLWGRGKKIQGCFDRSSGVSVAYRLHDQFLDYVRKYLVGAKMGKLHEWPGGKKAFYFQYKSTSVNHYFVVGYKSNLFIFGHHLEGESYWSSLGLKRKETREDFLNTDMEFDDFDSSDQETEWKEHQEAVKKESFYSRKAGKIQQDLAFVEQVLALENDMNVDIDPKLYRLKFTAEMTDWQKKNVIYEKIKKMKKARLILMDRLEKTLVEGHQQKIILKKQDVILIEMRPAKKEFKKNKDYRIGQIQFKGQIYYVALGETKEGNDQLRHDYSDSDWWFHEHHKAGPHLIVEGRAQLEMEFLQLLAGIMTNKNEGEVDLMFAKLKMVKGKKGSSGEVTVKNPKYMRVWIEVNWRELTQWQNF